MNILNWFRHLYRSEKNFNFFLLQDELRVLEMINDIHPDLVFIDLHLASISGEKIGEIIRTTSPYKIPVVYMSSSSPSLYGHKAVEQSYMKKPLNRPQVDGKILKYLKI